MPPAVEPARLEHMALRVVIVDDDRRFRDTARRALAAEGVEVVAEVQEGAAAAEAVRTWQPDVVLVDVRMPGVDGPEVARRLRQQGGAAAVILISTIDGEHGRRVAEGIAAGFLPKDELSLAAIQRVLGAG
jgi:CheY-like chemotaxis protein